MKKTRFISLLTLLAVCAMALPGTAMAHGVWFARRSDRIQLVCGEGWKDNAYDPDGLTTIKGYDADYADVAVEPIKGEDYLYIEPSDDLAAVYLEMDYGYWSTVQLLNNGEPMADVDIIPDVLNHHTETIKTDENGMATVTASNGGVNVIGCEMVVPYENEGVDQKATRSKVFVSLSFTLYPEEED